MVTFVQINKIITGSYFLFLATCTNDLVVNAKQINYLEMFLLSFIIEFKNTLMYSFFKA